MIDEKVICAGFGGQGLMSLGQLLAYGGMLGGLHVTWLPSYGPEMRGGTAYCSVMLSERPIGSPIIAGDATCAIIMNLPSLHKFEPSVSPEGLLLVNSSMVDETVARNDISTHLIPAAELAKECGNERAANMIMLGAYLNFRPVVSDENIVLAFGKVFGAKSTGMLDLNMRAVKRGKEYVAEKAGLHQAA